jgi:hypothetical protein
VSGMATALIKVNNKGSTTILENYKLLNNLSYVKSLSTLPNINTNSQLSHYLSFGYIDNTVLFRSQALSNSKFAKLWPNTILVNGEYSKLTRVLQTSWVRNLENIRLGSNFSKNSDKRIGNISSIVMSNRV